MDTMEDRRVLHPGWYRNKIPRSSTVWPAEYNDWATEASSEKQ